MLILYDGAPRLTQKHLEMVGSGELTFKDLVNEGVVEWIDAEEEEDLTSHLVRSCYLKQFLENEYAGEPVPL